MVPSSLDKQTAGCNTPHDWLMSLAMDLAPLCHKYAEIKMAPMDVILAVFTVDFSFACHYLSTFPYRSASGIGYASKIYLKWRAIHLVIHSIVTEWINYKYT